MNAAPVASSLVSITRASIPSRRHAASARAPNSSLPSREMNVTAAPARAAATAWFEPLPPGPILKLEPMIVSPRPGIRPARKARSATKMPRMTTPRFWLIAPGPNSWSEARLGRDNALLEKEAAVKTPLAASNHAIGLPGALVERHPLDRAHRPRFSLGAIDLSLHLGLDGRDFVGLAGDLHAQRRLVDEMIEGQQREDRLGRARGRHVVHVQQPAENRMARHRIGRKVRVAKHEFVAMTHAFERVKHVGVEA